MSVRSPLLAACLFALGACESEPPESPAARSRTPETIEATGRKESKAMEYATHEIWTGFGQLDGHLKGPLVTIIQTEAAWKRFLESEFHQDPQQITRQVDWSKEVVLLVQTMFSGGTMQLPEITSLHRDGQSVEITGRMRLNPSGMDTDEDSRPMLLLAVSAEAFSGDPKVGLEFELQGKGEVFHKR